MHCHTHLYDSFHFVSPLSMTAGLLPCLQVWPFRTRINIFALTHGQMTTCTGISWPLDGGVGVGYKRLTGIPGTAGWVQSGSCRGWPVSSRAPSHTWSAGWAGLRSETHIGAVIRRCSETPAQHRWQNNSYQKDCGINTALSGVWFLQGCVQKCDSWLYTQVRVFTSETIVQTSLLANMTVMKIARW